jgi:carboxyl-terminal processing protease
MKNNLIKKCILASLFCLVVFQSNSQVVPDSVYYKRLFYLCKVWGHAKYYHTEIAAGHINWDDELLKAVDGVKTAPDNAAFNDTIQRMLNNAGAMGYNPAILPIVPDSLNNNINTLWMHDTIFSDTVRSLLDTIKGKFRPQSNVYVRTYAAGNPDFTNDNLYYSGQNYPAENKRLLALFRYWNIINYFYPYKNIMDQNWDTTLVEFIPKIATSVNELSYILNMKLLTNRLNDSHAAYFNHSVYNNWEGNYYPPFLVSWIENEMVITKVLPGITLVSPGDVIKEIDGFEVHYLRDSLRKYSGGSNNMTIETNLNETIIWGNPGNFQIKVDNGSNIHTETLIRNSSNYNSLQNNTNPAWQKRIINDSCKFGIVDMGKLQTNQLSTMFNELWGMDVIIFDIRNYPNGTLWDIVNYLFASSIHIANFTVPAVTYPGILNWQYEYIGSGTSNPYSGQVMILFNEKTISQAEYTIMGLEQFPDAIKIGSTTAAADGNVSAIYLPGNIATMATFLGTFYPDYKPTQRVGIIPDYEVRPTIVGIRNGMDEVLQFALNCAFINDISKIENKITLSLFPNPADNMVQYKISTIDNSNTIDFEILDMYGKELKNLLKQPIEGKIDLKAYKSGIYFIKVISSDDTITKKIIKL